MNDVEAEKIARSYLCEQIEIERTEPSEDLALYNFRASEDIVFRFKLFGHLAIGSSEYVIVSRITGKVGYSGHCGE